MNYYYVYILQCKDDSYYIGVTNNLEKRVSEHQSGLIKGYTSKRLPVILMYHAIFNDIVQAIRFEKQIKKWSRKKKEALIKENWKELQKLSIAYRDHPSRTSG